MPIAILLATYNSGRRLRYQLDSLFLQNYKDWILYVHDDGSLDDTLDILAEYANRYKGKLYVMKDKEKGRGAKIVSFGYWIMSWQIIICFVIMMIFGYRIKSNFH